MPVGQSGTTITGNLLNTGLCLLAVYDLSEAETEYFKDILQKISVILTVIFSIRVYQSSTDFTSDPTAQTQNNPTK